MKFINKSLPMTENLSGREQGAGAVGSRCRIERSRAHGPATVGVMDYSASQSRL
jgi:hypothetical protein